MKFMKCMSKKLIVICAFSYICVNKVYAAEEGFETLVVGVYTDMTPYEAYNTDENVMKGIMIDYLRKISDNTGYSFHYEYINSKEELEEKLEEGKVDIVTSVMESENGLDITLTEPCFSDRLVVVVNKESIDTSSDKFVNDNIMEELDTSLRAGIVDRYSIYNELLEENGVTKFRYYTSYKDCIDGVQKKEVDYTILPELCAYKMTGHSYYEDILIYPYSDREYNICIGVSNKCNSEVLEKINQGINKISEYTKEQILLSNTALNRENPDVRDFVADYKKYVYVTFGIVTLIVVILLVNKLTDVKENKVEASYDIIKAYSVMLDTDVAVRSKEMLLSKLSHDMKNPMNSIMGMTELAKENVNKPELVEGYLKDILAAGKYLLSLINDILDMARIESGKMVLKKETVNLSELASEINTIVLPLAKNKQIRYEFIDGGINNVAVIADRHRLQQIIINLISNGIKYTKEGGSVSFYMETGSETNGKVDVFIKVSDTGIGVAKDVMLRLFEPFFQENRYDGKSSGTGLGLTIVNELVNLMSGHINFKSELGKGTEVTIKFVFDKGKDSGKQAILYKENYKIFAGMNVLIADDSEMNLEMVGAFLEKYKFNVHKAIDGKSCYMKFMESAENYYQFIIVDINMPDMTGDKVAELIRKSERADANTVKIIGLTAEAYDEEIKGKDMDGYMSKPLDSKLLFKFLYGLIRS